ncbi:MAG: FAD-dependent monooxygenase [Myxococcales bacterium]|nr:FAD-dependent monooxygenase [Myxococcales bacterium]MCB9641486.1 FAD-dependent monooxygenase [Myxococcales bacterium]
MHLERHEAVIVGAGLVGSLLAIFLRRRGLAVHVFEKRPDMRKMSLDGGRSINLIVTSRGLAALERVGLREAVLDITVPVFGRMIHDLQGELTYQSYSKDDTDCNYSVSRAQLNCALMDYAEQAGAVLHFDQELRSVDVETGRLVFSGAEVEAEQIFATDGAGSAVRRSLVEQGHLTDRVDFLSHSYKELLIPAGPSGSYLIEKRALHIWPRGEHMLMALPNLDGSMTVTLYLANAGERSFEQLQDPASIMAYFQSYYADAIPLMPHLLEEFQAHPVGLLGTVYCEPWHVGDRVLLLGDAAHGVVPFFGQGMNCGFEDCLVLDDLMNAMQDAPRSALFEAYTKERKPNGDAIAAMALENFVEMRDSVGDAQFLLQKEVEGILGRRFPTLYLSRYSMVTHSLIPYRRAFEAGLIQQAILRELCEHLDSAEQVDLGLAESLLEQKMRPFLEAHQIELSSFS